MRKISQRGIYRLFLVAADIFAISLAVIISYFSTVKNPSFSLPFLAWWGANLIVTGIVFLSVGLYFLVFSPIGVPEMIKSSVAAIVLMFVNLAFAFITKGKYITGGTAVFFALMLFCLTALSRSAKNFLLIMRRKVVSHHSNFKKVMIIGGGAAGYALIKEMQISDKITYKPVCVIDDDIRKHGDAVRGVKIVGGIRDVKKAAAEYHVDEIFVAMPSVEKKKISEIAKACQACGCPVKILPGMYQLLSGEVAITQLREIDTQDLLGREQVKVNLDEIMGYIEHKTVLVTGGGGSIGSELCRQIATHNPKLLIIFDIYENNAYEIEQELRRNLPNVSILALIGSVRDKGKMRDVFAKYRPQIVFHAAAHKHVPLMETSPNEAVKNNVIGTLNVARCADEFEVETFVQISTDKAVNPTNVMGASKRICEMIIQTIGRHSKHTKFVAVRFGNVLGSNGSVIPLFKKQIKEGGPVTVTHKDIIRYFMTIPEAVSLVLQAGAYAKGGQIFVLDMGEPVRIYDLAYNLIKLSGLEPNVDIDIVCTGLRPGEKLYEERLMKEEGLQKTPNGLINIARPIDLDESKLWDILKRLEEEAYAESEDMKKLVKELVPTYTIDKRDSIKEALSAKKNETNSTIA